MKIIEKFRDRVKNYGFQYVMRIIIRNKIYRPLDNTIFLFSKTIWNRIGLKDIIVLESHNDFDSNAGTFYDYLIYNNYNKKYKIVWLIKNKKTDNLPENVVCFNLFRPSFRKSYYNCVAKYLMCEDYVTRKGRADQKLFYLTHGAVSLKKPKGYMNLPQEIDHYLTASEFMAPIHADIFNFTYPNSKQIIVGYPAHDILYRTPTNELGKIIDKKFKKVIVWMPTFRKNRDFHRNDSSEELNLGIPVLKNLEDFKKLDSFLNQQETLLIIKIHPMQDSKTVKVYDTKNIRVLDGQMVKTLKVDNYRLLRETDAIISDYSSIAYDYLHLDRPIAYTMDDAKAYNLEFIVENPTTLMAGPIILNTDELIDFIADVTIGHDMYKEKRQKVFNKTFKYHDGNSCKRLVDFMRL